MEESGIEIYNRTSEQRRVAVRLERRTETAYSEVLVIESGETIARATGVTSHPLAVRATVDGSFDDVAAYEWHGCDHDVVSIDVGPRPEILSGCYDD